MKSHAGPRATSVVLHGHFYQPPREDPWTDRVPEQPTAAPYHDWNERIAHESYGPLARLGAFEWMSWDVGPTLLQWLERERPGIYDAIVAGDRAARRRTGFGNAIAQPYHHIILPLASRREKGTEVRWGIADFERRFGRAPEGMWLPETAVDRETLDVLAENGIRFTVLAPHQVIRPPPDGGPGRIALDGGREVSVFVYDGELSHGVAFGDLLRDPNRWLARIRDRVAAGATRCVSLATDGETFGHHHPGSEETLATVVERLRSDPRLALGGFYEVLAASCERPEVELVEMTSWSCAHGVERWRSECGCRMAPERESRQSWRGPLREALERLAGGLDAAYRTHAAGVLADPDEARDAYGAVFRASPEERAAFVRAVTVDSDEGTLAKTRALLSLARDRAAMFTSCGWFFDDVSGLEPTQVLRYAAHALDALGGLDAPEAARLERELVRGLAGAASNDPEVGSAGAIYRRIRDTHAGGAAWVSDSGSDASLPDDPPRAAAPRRGPAPGGGETTSPVRFALAVHLHQPVGNFDHVFEEHLEHVYRPFLEAVWERDALPISLHVSGPLLEWLAAHAPGFLDRLGRQVADGGVELLASGWSEPILAAWPRADRLEQLETMRAALRDRFGVEARGAWLTERVWEPDLPSDLAGAGIDYTLLDDRHFLATGLERGDLDRPYRTESGGETITVLPIDERLRYLIPFRPVEEIEAFFGSRRNEAARLLVLGDDGEKFGGWPDTREWVYEGGWLARFLEAVDRMRAEGVIEPVTTADAAAEPSGGLVYPPTGSYRELEAWALPRPAALALGALERGLERDRETGGSPSPFIRGGHWKGFLTRYPEANRMHKLALALSGEARKRGNPPAVRRALARAQCNDAYWHGVFGGIYLPHLRRAVWAALAEAERGLRDGEPASHETVDLDLDGHAEVRVRSPLVSVSLSPARGGAIEILLRLDRGENDADVLGRHLEAYHHDPADPRQPAAAGAAEPDATSDAGTASIHERERRATPPAVDRLPRAIFQERVYAGDIGTAELAAGTAVPLDEPAARPWTLFAIGTDDGSVVVELGDDSGRGATTKRIRFEPDGRVRVDLAWDPEAFAPDAWMTTELSLAFPRTVRHDAGTDAWRYDIVTLGRSERGFEEVRQGESVTVAWPAGSGSGWVTLDPPAAADAAKSTDPGGPPSP